MASLSPMIAGRKVIVRSLLSSGGLCFSLPSALPLFGLWLANTTLEP